MMLATGGFLVGLALLALAALGPIFRGSDPPGARVAQRGRARFALEWRAAR